MTPLPLRLIGALRGHPVALQSALSGAGRALSGAAGSPSRSASGAGAGPSSLQHTRLEEDLRCRRREHAPRSCPSPLFAWPAQHHTFASQPHSGLHAARFSTAADTKPTTPAQPTDSAAAHAAAPGAAAAADTSTAGAGASPASSAPAAGEESPPVRPSGPLPLPTTDVVYHGPLAYTHKLLKRISIANTMIAFAAAPAIIMWAETSYVSRVGLASAMVFFGLITTGALHWITNPYVHELRYTAATKMLDVRTSTLFGRAKWAQFHLSDVQVMSWERPVATFMAKGRPYYIDIFSFPDEGLLQRLTPDEASIPKGYKDDEDD